VQYLLLGLGLGVGAGLAPGPLLALVVTTALSRGFGPALRVAFVPLASDSVVVLVSLFVVHALPTRATGVLGVVGGLFVVWLGIEALREQPAEVEAAPTTGSVEFGKGVLVNLLSPHPWLFWLTVGGPILVAAWASNPVAAVAFLVSFYAVLVGSKVVIAAAVAGGRRTLSPRALHRAHQVAGVLLLLAGALLVTEFAGPLLHG
jgi:threonine/homoserine/homoserine lactone efflux protein